MFDFDPEAVDFGKLAQLQLSSYLVWCEDLRAILAFVTVLLLLDGGPNGICITVNITSEL